MPERPQVTRTTHILPFERLSPLDFERLCLWLVRREGYDRAEHLGAVGGEQGRDNVAWRDGRRVVFQCKRVGRLNPSGAEKEIEKLRSLPAEDQPDDVVFVVSTAVSVTTRDRARAAWGDEGSCDFWAGSELDERVKRHPELVSEFFEGWKETIRALHQLPTPPADFTGREAELAELLGTAANGVTITSLRGAGGIGKTALALKLAEHLGSTYPDAQFFLDLRGAHEQRPLSSQEAMRHVIQSWRPTDKLPESDTELVPMYRSVLHGKRVLLLMDNAKDERQVQPLIPPEGSFLLVTSRQRFLVPGLKFLNLDTLLKKDAEALLLSICPRLADTALALAKLCGYYALALRVSASTLASREDLAPDDYVNQLRTSVEYLDKEAPDYVRSCTASIALSYNLLSEELKQRWRFLAVFEGSFDLEAAASVWAIEHKLASKQLGSLLKQSLIECNPRNQRFYLHDLVRQVANERLGPG